MAGHVDVLPGPSGAHLASLISLRLVAAAWVVALHVAQNLPVGRTWQVVTSQAHLGLTFFFVLSGFVLTLAHRPGDGVRRFHGRRVARVVPLHLAATALAAVLLLLAGRELDLAVLPLVLSLTHALVPDPGVYYSYNSVSWSLSCEAVFYLLFPVLLGWCARHVRRPLRWLVGTGLALAATGAAVVVLAGPLAALTGLPAHGLVGYSLTVLPVYRAGEFVVGVLLGLAVARGHRSPVGLPGALALAVASVAALTVVGLVVSDLVGGPNPGAVSEPVTRLLALPVLALVVVAAADDDASGRVSFLHAPALVHLGRASFALYLVHLLVIGEVRDRVAPHVPLAVSLLVVVTVSVGTALLAHRYLEQPLERRLRLALAGPRVSIPTGLRAAGSPAVGPAQS